MTIKGIVRSVENGLLTVTVLEDNSTECAGCKLKGFCKPGNKSDKILTIRSMDAFTQGDRIILEVGEGRSIWISFLLYFVPLLVMAGAYALFFFTLKLNEMLSILFSVLSAIAYFAAMLMIEKHLIQSIDIRRDASEKLL